MEHFDVDTYIEESKLLKKRGRKNEGKSSFTFENEEDLLDNLQYNNEDFYNFISNIVEYLNSFFNIKDNEEKLLALKEIYINITYSDLKVKDKTLSRSFGHILLKEIENLLPNNIKDQIEQNIDKLDTKFIYMNKILIPLIKYLDNRYYEQLKFSNNLKSDYTYDNSKRYTIINGFNLLIEDYNIFNKNKDEKLENGTFDIETIQKKLKIIKEEKIEFLRNQLKEYNEITNEIKKIDKKYELAEIIFDITDNLKTYFNIDEIKVVFNEVLTTNETNIIFDIYTSNFYNKKTKEFLSEIDTTNETYLSPLCNDRKWLEISKENKSILINFLENVKRKGLSEYIPLLDSIIEINYKNEKFLEKLKNIQDDIKNKDNNESELIVKEYVNELIENYSKRYKLKDGNIQEVEKQTRFDIKDSGEIDFFIAGAGELDGVCFDDKDKPTVFFVNFCTTKKETSEQHQIFRHIPKFIKYVEENFGITNVVPKVFNQSLIPDLYRKKQGNGWYKNKDIKLEQSEKSAFNVLSSLNFMYHQINSLGIEELSKKADNILEIVKIQPFDTKDLETFNSLNSFEEKFQYIAQQTIHVAKFFAKNQQYLSSDNYSGNKKDLYMSFFDACLYIEDKLKNNQDSTNEDNNFLQEYKNGIKNILNNVWNKQDMISIAESDGSRNKLFSMFLEKFNLINIEQKQEKIKNFNIEF